MSLYAWRKIFMNGKTVRPLFLQPFLIFHAVPCIREKEKNMKEYKPFKSGKVRELYDLGDSLVMVCTDRISAFDVILKDPVPEKGAILNKMSKFWFDFTKDIVPNHMISIDTKDMPEFFRTPEFEGRSMLTQKLKMLPVECIVRGYITGSGWESYKKEGKICGIQLPEGLQECQKLPEALFTPSTKAPIGEHDMNISMEEGAVWLEKFFPGKGKEYMEKMRDLTLALYKKCADYALERGIIIADTKFEFGLDKDGNVVLGDEMLTPDNSRFWPLEGYEAGKSQPSYDKQYVRDYLKSNNAESLTEEVTAKTVEKYKEAYELLTGKKFA
jgi:phosphoribosylaminoimidazole-succinocarboxamide synthase